MINLNFAIKSYVLWLRLLCIAHNTDQTAEKQNQDLIDFIGMISPLVEDSKTSNFFTDLSSFLKKFFANASTYETQESFLKILFHLRPEEEETYQKNTWPLWIDLLRFPYLSEKDKTHVVRIFFSQNEYPKTKFALDILGELLKDPTFFHDISQNGKCNQERAQELGKERILYLMQEAMQNPIQKGLPFLNDLRHFFTFLFCFNFYDLDFKTLEKKIKQEENNIRKNFFNQSANEQLWILLTSPLVPQEPEYFSRMNEILPHFNIQSQINTFLETQKILSLPELPALEELQDFINHSLSFLALFNLNANG